MKWGNVGTKIQIGIHFRALKPKNCPIPLVRDTSKATYLHDHHRTETIEFRALSPYGFPSFLLALLAICVEQHSPPPTCHCFFFAYLSSSTRLVLSAAINCSVSKREIYIERETVCVGIGKVWATVLFIRMSNINCAKPARMAPWHVRTWSNSTISCGECVGAVH